MRNIGILVVTCGLVLGSAQSQAAGFDTDLEGWTTVGFDVDATIGFPSSTLNSITLVPTTGDMMHSSTGGNPGGFAELTDAVESPASWARAPQSFIPTGGDLSGFTSLLFDHNLFDNGIEDGGGPAEIFPYAVILISGDPTDLNAIVWTAPAPTMLNEWIEFDIAINDTSFTLIEDLSIQLIDPSLPDITPGSLNLRGNMSIQDILMNVTDILIPFELSNNEGNQMSESAGIDNIAFTMVPEPTAIVLLLLAGAALRLRRS